ncbi:hypothetical protein GOODEAATRI_013001, partial [Goodea atripinnis]
DSDLKHYLDNCGNLMSMHNVKVWRGLNLSPQRPTLMKWLLFGIDLPTCYWAPQNTPCTSTCGEKCNTLMLFSTQCDDPHRTMTICY